MSCAGSSYDTGNSGILNTGDLYIDANLTDGISFGTPADQRFYAGDAVSHHRFGAAGSRSCHPEIRDYDNIVVSTTERRRLMS